MPRQIYVSSHAKPFTVLAFYCTQKRSFASFIEAHEFVKEQGSKKDGGRLYAEVWHAPLEEFGDSLKVATLNGEGKVLVEKGK